MGHKYESLEVDNARVDVEVFCNASVANDIELVPFIEWLARVNANAISPFLWPLTAFKLGRFAAQYLEFVIEEVKIDVNVIAWLIWIEILLDQHEVGIKF